MILDATDPEKRKGLEKYYEFVKTCHVCKQDYGLDKENEETEEVCPACIRMGIRRWKNG